MNKIKNSKGFTLVELLVVIGILGILMGALFPAISSAMIKANLSACGMRGRNLFVAITSANTEREALGLGNVWPKTEQEENADTAERDHNDPKRCYDRPAEIFRERAEHAILQCEAEARGGVQHAGGRSVFAVFREMHIVMLREKNGWRKQHRDHCQCRHNDGDRQIADKAEQNGEGKRERKHCKDADNLVFDDFRKNEEANEHRSRDTRENNQRV